MDPELDARLKREHFEKYNTITTALGQDYLARVVTRAFSADQIRSALAAGDVHLNTLSLRTWDRLTADPIFSRRHPLPPNPDWNTSMSLAECVCALKHVAKYVVAV